MTRWDGVHECYVPEGELQLDPSVQLHTAADAAIDPVTYEVIRSSLWNINAEAGEIITRVSGSPIAQYAHDLNTVLLTEDAEYLYTGPYNLNLAVVIDLAVKWIMEFRSSDPGISEGDIFLSTDPFVGASHVTDTIMASPIFIEGQIFGWAASSFHQYDMGGSAPGGYSPDARNRFEEADPIPPVKIVEGEGEVRRDLLEWYLRKSRTPELLELDLRSQIAGCNYSKARVHALVDAYGAGTVKAAMRKILDDGEQAFALRLEAVPAGTWSCRGYVESALPGDREVYKTVLNVTKEEDGRLVIDHQGTSDQEGVLSISYAAWRAGVMPPLVRLLCDDTIYALGGAMRRIDFKPSAGTLFCASHPAATGNPGIGICQAGSLATVALSRMLSIVEDEAQDVFATAGTSIYPISALSGVDQSGNYFGTIHMEPMAGGLGAFRDADGEDTGGTVYDALALAPNVEYSEQYFPILFLYRRELPGSGGPGRYRGGNSGVFAYVPHRAEVIDHYTATSGSAVPSSLGLWGGHPGATNRDTVRRGTDALARLRGGEIPQGLAELSGETEYVPPKERDVLQRPDDVWEVRWAAGGGFGDPLEREPEAVLADVLHENLDVDGAREFYGVVIEGEAVDAAATEALRQERLAQRLAGAGDAPATKPEGELVVHLGPTLSLVRAGSGVELTCRACGTGFGPLAGWKQRALTVTKSVEEANPEIDPPGVYVDDPVLFRSYHCRGCGRSVDSEVTVGDDLPFDDIALKG
ncbi:MAG: hydantoinase B/oxoprolinase family protein [Solirubrobacterales bacterium]